MTARTVRKQLIRMNACKEAVEWASSFATLQEAWEACERADWMLWLVGKIDGKYSSRLRLAACACAATALQYVPKGENRPRRAISVARKFANGKATREELAAAYAAYAAYAPYAAAYAAHAAHAAYADSAGAAEMKAFKLMSSLVRKIIPTVQS